ncbi:MAG: hypothetical protein ACYDAR_10430 [Thermomicrobiales bacterium]
MEKQRTVLYLTAETAHALGEYLRLHRARFRSRSDAAEHLLRRALAGGLDEGVEDLLAPTIVRAVREATRREIQDGVGALVERQSNRLAALLVGSGKDAFRAARIAEVVLGHLLADPVRAARVAEEARLQAGARYRPGSNGDGESRGDLPPGRPARPPRDRE